ncbi:MAG: hypothetical protein GX556_04810 [Fibrobacter sp.]|nr:hypothetical protein [Fibrobacter sp.]
MRKPTEQDCNTSNRRRFAELTAVLLICVLIVNGLIFSVSAASRGAKAAAGIGIPVVAVGTGIAVYFTARNAKRDRLHGDTVIAQVNICLDSATHLFKADSFYRSAEQLRRVLPLWAEYSYYLQKRELPARPGGKDSINSAISRCDFLYSLSDQVLIADSFTAALPDDPDILAASDRHQLFPAIAGCRKTIDSIAEVNKEFHSTTGYAFRRSISRLNRVDSLFSVIYDSQKDDFTYKNKYYYNRAVESKDSTELRKLMSDCDYYQVDKQWCERMRLALNPPIPVQVEEMVTIDTVVENKKLTAVDSMKLSYSEAIGSGRIELLEEYLEKYSGRRFSKKVSKIDSVRIVLDSLKKIVEREELYNRQHPLFTNADPEELTAVVLGLPGDQEEIFRSAIETRKTEIMKADGIRFPSILKIDYSQTPPIIMMNAFVNAKDAEKEISGESTAYSLPGVSWLMQELDALKQHVLKELEKRGSDSEQVRKIKTAAYIVRLNKNVSDYITFYGKENLWAQREGQVFKYYDFFDITLKDHNDVRFSNEPSHTIIIRKDSPDTLKHSLCTDFFQ